MRYIASHDAEEIASHVPPDFYAGDRAMYVQALADGKVMFTPDGRMPEGGAEDVLEVLAQFMGGVTPAAIDPSRT